MQSISPKSDAFKISLQYLYAEKVKREQAKIRVSIRRKR